MSVGRYATIAALLLCISGRTVWAQDEEEVPPPPVKSSAIIVAGSSDGGAMTFEMATPLGVQSFATGGAVLSSPLMMGAGVSTNSVGWLDDDDILNELDIVEDQRARLREIREQEMKKRQDFFNTIRGMEPNKIGEFVREFGTMLKADIDQQVADVLLPHQVKRLDQLRLQTSMRGMGARALETESLVKALGITDEQKQQLREKEREVREDLQKKLEQLRKEAQEEVLTVLTDAQRKKLSEMLGEDYEFKPRPFTFPPQPAPKPKADKD